MIIEDEEYLAHYGIIRRSGRYPWGSGLDEPQHNRKLVDHIRELEKSGMSQPDIAKGLGMSTTQLRAERTIAKDQIKREQIFRANQLKEKGVSNVEGARQMGIPEPTYRTLLASGAKDKANALTSTADMLKREVDEKTYVDIGKGTEIGIKISQQRLRAASEILKAQGYEVITVNVPQLGTGKDTKTKVLAPPGTTWGDVMRNREKIRTIQEYSEDHGRSFIKVQKPLAINPNRVAIKYKEDGGEKEDGVIYVRPGVKDLEMGNTRYSQVRIQVGPKHYLKGMAVYKDDLPDGVDLLFNTNKSKAENPKKTDVMKELSKDEDLPFSSIVRQITNPKTGKVSSVMNIVGTKETSGIEGSWDDWAKSLSSQMLSKQSPVLAKKQLDQTYQQKRKDLDEINALTNPTVKKKLLEEFADGTDSAAVHMKAASLPRQATRVILPMNSLKETEVYAPGFNDGERVALVRYPHGGTFEIPELTVNNRHAPAKKIIGDSKDAIGIHHKVAQKLSGADFDGDTVIVIPNNSNKIKSSPPLEGLKNFDPMVYKLPKDSPTKRMTAHEKGVQMGVVSNLITDMTIRGASHDKLARAVKHSMVVIDAEKHELDWKLSEKQNGIKALVAEYQTPYKSTRRGGASTLISRAKSPKEIPELKPRPMKEGGPVDRETGALIRVPSGKTYFSRKTGQKELVTKKYPLLSLIDDAHELSTGTPVEEVYANHSNKLKSLANEARLSSIKTPRLNYSPSAKQQYAAQAASLKAALALAEQNAPRERQAQVLAGYVVKTKKQADPTLTKETLKKIESQALNEARNRTGASKQKIVISDDEWKAIQAGAISDHMLRKILNNADMDVVRSHATPKAQRLMTSSKTTRARSMLASGMTRAEVAQRLGVSITTLDRSIDA